MEGWRAECVFIFGGVGRGKIADIVCPSGCNLTKTKGRGKLNGKRLYIFRYELKIRCVCAYTFVNPAWKVKMAGSDSP